MYILNFFGMSRNLSNDNLNWISFFEITPLAQNIFSPTRSREKIKNMRSCLKNEGLHFCLGKWKLFFRLCAWFVQVLSKFIKSKNIFCESETIDFCFNVQHGNILWISKFNLYSFLNFSQKKPISSLSNYFCSTCWFWKISEKQL